MIIGIDAGNYETKVVGYQYSDCFLSCIGEARKRYVEETGADDMIVKFGNKEYFAGTLAKRESHYTLESKGETKAHHEGLLRILIALHRAGEKRYEIVVGQPISGHTKEEKEKIKRSLLGLHEITINDVTRTFTILDVNISPEGAAPFLTKELSDMNIVDVGSGTVNIATIRDGFFINKGSETLNFGSSHGQYERLTESIIASTRAIWKRSDTVYLCGGIAEEIKPYLEDHYGNVELLNDYYHSKFANAEGFYNLGVLLYEKS